MAKGSKPFIPADPSGNPIVSNVTELPNRTLRLVSFSFQTDVNGYGEFLFKCPGTFNGITRDVSNGRYIFQAEGWFENGVNGDRVLGAWVVDQDGLISEPTRPYIPTWPVIGSYTEDLADPSNQGWYIYPTSLTKIEAANGNGAGFIPCGMYLKVKVQKAAAITDRFFVNLKWAERSV